LWIHYNISPTKKITSVSGTVRTNIPQRQDQNDVYQQVTADDYCSALLHFEDDFVGTLQVSVITVENTVYRLSVSGLKGTLTINDNKLTFFKATDEGSRGGTQELLLEDSFEKEPPCADVWGLGTVEIAKAIKDKMMNKDSTALNTAATFTDGLYTQRVIEAIRKSSATACLEKV